MSVKCIYFALVHISSLSAADAVMDEVANKLRSPCNVMIMPVASQDLFVPLTLDMFPDDEDSYNVCPYSSYGAGMYTYMYTNITRTNAIYQYLHKVSICAYEYTFY